MEYQIAVYSGDAVFSRMLELEFSSLGKSVLTKEHPEADDRAEVVLLDLDTAVPPAVGTYHRMIGFTRAGVLSADEAHRRCTMIFHRPFEMRLLRREVLGEEHLPRLGGAVEVPPLQELRLSLDREQFTLSVGSDSIALSPKEFDVMQCLLQHRGTAVSRDRIAEVIGDSTANKTDVYICLLRRKLEARFGNRIIKTVRGKGYTVL